MMPSFSVVNYSLRPNKGIQRAIVFEGVKKFQEHLELSNLMYVGMGSIWFSDFISAHRELNIRDMISIESDDIGYERAKFNKPYKTVRVEHGRTTDVLTTCFADDRLSIRPWFVWLDYDGHLDEDAVQDLRLVVENAPPNSILVTTFNAVGFKYAKPKDRPELIKRLLGDVVPDDFSRDDCDDDNLPTNLAKLVQGFLVSVATSAARLGGFEPAFKILYRDGQQMVTVGGILPTPGSRPAVRNIVNSREWTGIAPVPVETPPLTIKEATTLQSQLPRTVNLTRSVVKRLGFDLGDDELKAFETYYKYYPSFAQVVT